MGDPLRAAVAAPGDGTADGAVEAAGTVARWLTTLPKADWTGTETAPAWAAFDAAARCALQLAVVKSRPDPSSSQYIHALVRPADQTPADAATDEDPQ
jgi:hypothetical protein